MTGKKTNETKKNARRNAIGLADLQRCQGY
jgi:hypothetical protein